MLAPSLALALLIGQAPASDGDSSAGDVVSGSSVVAIDFATLDELAALIAAEGPDGASRSPHHAALLGAGRLFKLPGPARIKVEAIGVCPRYLDDMGRPIPVYSGRLLEGPYKGQTAALFPTQLAVDRGKRRDGGAVRDAGGNSQDPMGPAEDQARLLARFRTIYREARIAEARAYGRIKEPPVEGRERALADASLAWRAEVVHRFALASDSDLEAILAQGRETEEAEGQDRQRRVLAKRRARGEVDQKLTEIGRGLSAELSAVLRQSAIDQARREAEALNVLKPRPQ